MAYGAILGQTSSGGIGKRVCRFVIGTSTSGWTANDCDYLCDGTSDNVEINAAISALPSTGGEIIILDGTYNIASSIATISTKQNILIRGNGNATILKRMSNSINLFTLNTSSCIKDLTIDDNNNTFSGSTVLIEISSNNVTIDNISTINNANLNISIFVEKRGSGSLSNINIKNNNLSSAIVFSFNTNEVNIINNIFTQLTISNNMSNSNIQNNVGIIDCGNTLSYVSITENICNNGTDGITIEEFNHSILSNNICCNNSNNGINMTGSGANQSCINGNVCNNNSNYGIYLSFTNYMTASGNVCNLNGTGIYVFGNVSNVVISNINGNTCYNNTESGITLARVENSLITGNIFMRGTGQSSDYSESQYTIYSTYSTSNNLIANNSIMGKNYVDEGSHNTFINNKYN